jgi:hypothetical protein
VHPPVDIPPRKGIARRGAGRLSRGGGRVRPGGAMGKGYIARGHRPVAGSQLDEKVESTRVTEAISDCYGYGAECRRAQHRSARLR